LLLIAFVLVPVFWFSHVDPVELFTGPQQTLDWTVRGQFGHMLALVLFEAVLFAVMAMTPAYSATAIAEEKERQTLGLLLTTALSDREIVLGKAVGRLVFVLAAAAAALPVLAMARLFSPVGGDMLLTGCGLIVGTAVLCTAAGVNAACALPDLRAALLRAYGLTVVVVGCGLIPPCVVASPFGVMAWVNTTDATIWTVTFAAIAYPTIQMAIAAGLFRDAVRNLRKDDSANRPPPRTVTVELPEELRPVDLHTGWDPEPNSFVVTARPAPSRRRPPISGSNPLLWKERYATGLRARPSDAARVTPWFFAVLGIVFMAFGFERLLSRLGSPGPIMDEGGRLMMTGGVLVGGAYLFPAAVALASTVARERRRSTLESLLALPLTRRFLLRSKVRAAVERGWWWVPIAVAAAGTAFGADGDWRLGLAAAGFVLTGIGFVIALGTYLTVRTPTEVRAFRFLVPAVVVVVGAPVGVWNATNWDVPLLAEIEFGAAAIAFAIAGPILWWRAGRQLERGF
jgi:ABC-type Na+ efflux pump permease subunit